MNGAIEELYVYMNHLLAHELEAMPLEVPSDLASIEGEFKGRKVCMKSKAWETPLYRYIRYTGLESEGKLSTFNFVIYPRSCYDAPIFASDWVVNQQQLRIAVMDAMPLFPEEDAYKDKWVAPFSGLGQKSQELAPVFDRKLSWSTKYLGENACLATGVPSDRLSPLVRLWKSYLHLYLYITANLSQVSPKRQTRVEEWHRRYNSDHKDVENKRNPYMVYFGEEMGRRYNEEFLFPDRIYFPSK